MDRDSERQQHTRKLTKADRLYERSVALPEFTPGVELHHLDKLERDAIRDVLEMVAPAAFQVLFGTRLDTWELCSLHAAFLGQFDKAASIDTLLALGPERKSAIRLSLNSLLCWFWPAATGSVITGVPNREAYSPGWWDTKEGDPKTAASVRWLRHLDLSRLLVRREQAGMPGRRPGPDLPLILALHATLGLVPHHWELIAALANDFLGQTTDEQLYRKRVEGALHQYRVRLRRFLKGHVGCCACYWEQLESFPHTGSQSLRHGS